MNCNTNAYGKEKFNNMIATKTQFLTEISNVQILFSLNYWATKNKKNNIIAKLEKKIPQRLIRANYLKENKNCKSNINYNMVGRVKFVPFLGFGITVFSQEQIKPKVLIFNNRCKLHILILSLIA